MKRPLVALFLSLCFGIAAAKAGTSGLLTGLIIFGAGLFLLYVAARSGLVNVSRWVCKKAYPMAASFLLLIPVLFSAGYFRRTVYDAVTEKERAPYLSLFDSCESEVVIEGRIKRISAEDGKYEIHLKDCSVRSAYGRDFCPAGGCVVYADCDAVSEGRIPASGNTLKVYGKMRPYLNAANPGQFDAYEFHLSDREYAYISAKKLWITGENRAVFSDFVSRARNKMKDTLSMLYDREQAGILTAMLAGDRSLMEDETRALYKKAGISHILAVSGLHVSFMCMGLYNLLQRLKCGAAVSRAVAFIALVLFVIYSGAGTSAIRAGLMTTVMLLARALRRRYDMLSALAAAGIVLLLVFPHDTGNAAFVLSFSAVPGIYAANELKLKKLSGAAITLTTLPGVLFFFYETPVYGVVINIFVIPLTGCILVFGAASALLGMIFLPLGGMAAGTVCILLRLIGFIARIAGHFPFSYICTGKPTTAGMAFYLLLLIAAYHVAVKSFLEKEKRALKYTVAAGFLLLALCFLLSKVKRADLAFLSVGQGDCFVYMHNGACTVVDCGSSDTGSVGKCILSPYLKHSGEILIDEFVVTHTDDDHVNGLIELLESMPVYKGEMRYTTCYDGNPGIKRLIMPRVEERNEKYDRIVSLALSKNVEVIYASTGYTFAPGALKKGAEACFTCLAPANALVSENETSLVFLLETAKYSVILTGDADIAEEEEALEILKRTETKILLDRQGKAGKIKKRPQTVILKAGHHGSRTSASEAFVSCLSPDIAVVSCGKNNSYGHPHKETLALFEHFGVSLHRTDKDGALLLK